MSVSKKLARKVIFPAAMKLGFDKLLRNIASGSMLNVMYHGVVQKDSGYFSPRHNTALDFESQIKYLKKNFEIISLSEAFLRLRNGEKNKRKAVTISFDDGFRNNLTNALPILEKHKVPATFFISGVCAEENGPQYLWAEITAALNYFHKDKVIKIRDYNFVHLNDPQKGMSMSRFIKNLPYGERDRILDELKQSYGLDNLIRTLPDEIWKLLTKDELAQFSQSGYVHIGSHGYHHYNLGKIDAKHAREELAQSKRLLQDVIGKEINMIAYPDGDYTGQVKDIAEEEGYTEQLAVNYRVENDKQDLRIMNRFGISTTTTIESNILFLNKAFLNQAIN